MKKNEEKAKVWRTNQPSNNSSVETTPNSSVEIVPKVVQAPASTSEPRSHSSPVETTTQAEDVPSECNAFCIVGQARLQCLLWCYMPYAVWCMNRDLGSVVSAFQHGL